MFREHEEDDRDTTEFREPLRDLGLFDELCLDLFLFRVLCRFSIPSISGVLRPLLHHVSGVEFLEVQGIPLPGWFSVLRSRERKRGQTPSE